MFGKDLLVLIVLAVYKVPCECRANYVGQTSHLVSVRIKQDSRLVRLAQTDISAICWLKGHQAKFKDTKILYRSNNWHKRIIRKSLEIALTSLLINQEEGAHLSVAWLHLYDRLRGDAEVCLLIARS